MKIRQPLIATAVGLAGMVALAGPAAAHVTPSEPTAPAGAYTKFDLRVGHGCGESGNTTKVEVKVPDGVTTVTPQVVPGWTIERTPEQLDEPLDDGHGGQITERTAIITWTGGPLAHDQLQEFGLSVKMPDTPGETMYFPTIQTCDDGSTAEWVQIPDASGEEPESPAPAIELTASTGDDHGSGTDGDTATGSDGPTSDDQSSDDEAAPVEDASSEEASDDDGTDPAAIAGVLLGAIGIAIGGYALSRTRRPA